jgi:hypothetical protein
MDLSKQRRPERLTSNADRFHVRAASRYRTRQTSTPGGDRITGAVNALYSLEDRTSQRTSSSHTKGTLSLRPVRLRHPGPTAVADPPPIEDDRLEEVNELIDIEVHRRVRTRTAASSGSRAARGASRCGSRSLGSPPMCLIVADRGLEHPGVAVAITDDLVASRPGIAPTFTEQHRSLRSSRSRFGALCRTALLFTDSPA